MIEAAKKRGVLVQLRLRGRRVRGHCVGFLVDRDERGALVDYPGNPHGALVARTTVPLEGLALDPTGAKRREVLLVFEQERSDQPVIVGLLETLPKERTTEKRRTTEMPPQAPASHRLEARVDGRRVELDAEDEIVLRCGEASITLRRNGRVVIRGAYVETRSRGVNRIKGGSVQIN